MKIINKIRYALASLLVAGGSSFVSADCRGITANSKAPGCCAATNFKCTNGTDVVIIGAGWAGLAAAMELAKYNAFAPPTSKITFCVIEANTFHGGRAAAAHWISGGEGNPLAKLLWNNANLSNVRYDTQKWNDIQYYDTKGKKIPSTVVRKATLDFVKIYECAQDEAFDFQDAIKLRTAGLSNFTKDEGMRKVLNYCAVQKGVSWQTSGTSGGLQSVLEWYDFDYEFGRTPEKVSMWAYPLGPYLFFQDKDWFVSHPDNSAIIARAAADELGVCDKIQTSTEVCLVKGWNNKTNLVEIRTRPAKTSGPDSSLCATSLMTKKVIVTVSEGVLEQRGDNMNGLSMFDPPLGTIGKIRKLYEMIDYMEIFFKFSENKWNSLIAAAGIETFQFTVVETASRGRCNVLQTYQTRWNNEFFGRTAQYPKGSRVLVCVLTTDTLQGLSTTRDALAQNTTSASATVNTLIKESLGKVVPNINCAWRSPPFGVEDIIYKDPVGDCQYWTFPDNPWWKGSYENFELQGTNNSYSDFFIATQANESSYLNSSLHLAGSATCFNMWGFMPGAYYSGIREANKVIDALRGRNYPLGFTPTPQICEAARGGPGNIRPPKSS